MTNIRSIQNILRNKYVTQSVRTFQIKRKYPKPAYIFILHAWYIHLVILVFIHTCIIHHPPPQYARQAINDWCCPASISTQKQELGNSEGSALKQNVCIPGCFLEVNTLLQQQCQPHSLATSIPTTPGTIHDPQPVVHACRHSTLIQCCKIRVIS